MFLNSFGNKKYIFTHVFLWDEILKIEVVLKAYSKIGIHHNFYLNIHLITWDDILHLFLFLEMLNHINLLKNLDVLGI